MAARLGNGNPRGGGNVTQVRRALAVIIIAALVLMLVATLVIDPGAQG